MRVLLIILLFLEFGFAKKVALVIGNSNYSKGYLSNPISDAKLIRDTLEDDLKFDVTYKSDLTKHEMEKAIRDFSSSINSDDIALFYYSGHGMQYNRLNYLIPLKAEAVTEGQIPSVGVDVNYILGGMDSAKLAIVLLDACRNNPFRSFTKSGNKGLAQISSPQRNYIVSYATEAGAVAKDGDGSNSPYALALKEFLTKPYEISVLLKKVKNRVATSTSYVQVPYVDDRYIGEFRLSNGGGSCSKVVKIPATYRTVSEKVKVSDEQKRVVKTPTIFKTVYLKVLAKPSYRIYKWDKNGIEQVLEPKFIKVTKKTLASESYYEWRIDEEKNVKKQPIPAKYKTFTIYKISEAVDLEKIPKDISYKAINIPATYKKVSKRVVATPSDYRVITGAVKYKTITKKVLVAPETEKTISVPCSEVE